MFPQEQRKFRSLWTVNYRSYKNTDTDWRAHRVKASSKAGRDMLESCLCGVRRCLAASQEPWRYALILIVNPDLISSLRKVLWSHSRFLQISDSLDHRPSQAFTFSPPALSTGRNIHLQCIKIQYWHLIQVKPLGKWVNISVTGCQRTAGIFHCDHISIRLHKYTLLLNFSAFRSVTVWTWNGLALVGHEYKHMLCFNLLAISTILT